MQTISFSYCLGHATVCHIIDDTCQALWDVLSGRYLKPPSNGKKSVTGFVRLGIYYTVLEPLTVNI